MNIVLLESLGIPDSLLNECAKPLIDAGHTFTAFEKSTDTKVQIEQAQNADVIMIANMPLNGEVIDACKNLKFIDVAFTGVDHVDLAAARKNNISVSNAAGYSTEAVAELSLCLMLSLLRNVMQTDARCREGKTKDGLVGCELRGKTIGIVGAGAIGTRTAELCKAFGCRVLGCKRTITGNEPDFMEFVSLDELLSNSDIVSLHCPLNEDSRHLINKDTIAKMKQGAYIINAARGPVVDSKALAEALNSGYLAGAGIDVFENEPPIDTSHPLLNCKNTIVTPHIAFASAESMKLRAQIVFENLKKWMEGDQINKIL
ncbi:D-3-phosphoglycerate dehydrogenase [Lacrimispora xylanisolvens]|jgi:D-3-phosphoglycerate dehydrogenase|uniref:D-3-phosphoglycerate dehydrogenase n=1 Tax=Lacrimispora xylanisolvens TaxID=384636 RepID=A0A2S6HM94_9FIRM|nr:NAD(P)-dependent oxidoreductase [Hungatella xylanolytica]MBE5986878.1 hydroxyacid dehydrogenase [Paenibacillaceae bacterium]PPK78609.1 D-3-phosphoglycerate dehydrogenase [Hungatella xylanolytica]